MDIELNDLINKLSADERVVELVQIMQPLDIAIVVSKKLDLCSKDAAIVTKNLLQHAQKIPEIAANIETNKQFPVPSMLKKGIDTEVEESAGNFINASPTIIIPRHHFPPDPRQKVGDWPYDDMTTAAMDTKNKTGRRRPLMQGKNPLHTDLRSRQPGGDGAGGQGIYSKNSPHNRDNSTSSSGRSWDKKGMPGWSSSPPGKEFDVPDDLDNLPLMKPSPVGSPIPSLNYGGHSQQRRMGFRRK